MNTPPQTVYNCPPTAAVQAHSVATARALEAITAVLKPLMGPTELALGSPAGPDGFTVFRRAGWVSPVEWIRGRGRTPILHLDFDPALGVSVVKTAQGFHLNGETRWEGAFHEDALRACTADIKAAVEAAQAAPLPTANAELDAPMRGLTLGHLGKQRPRRALKGT